jgi:predicted alpha/beta superfamily hydrolase
LPGFALLAAPLHAQGTPAREDAVPAHDTLTVASRAVGETRLINVHTPPGYASASARFPVLYMPDGGINEDFPHVVQTIDSLIAAGAIRPVIVVGIPNTERRRDMTGPTRFAADSSIATRVGGSAAFRGFIRDELILVIETRYRTTKERAIVGSRLRGYSLWKPFSLSRRSSSTTSPSTRACGGMAAHWWTQPACICRNSMQHHARCTWLPPMCRK